MNKKNGIIKIFGWSSIIFGGLINVLMFIFGWYPTLLFFILIVIGLILLLIGRRKRQIKPLIQIVISALPFIVYFTIHLINLPSSDTFLIPKNFRGIVYVYYDQNNGIEKEFEGSRRVYRIPKDGILLTKFDLKGDEIDLSNSKFYLVDEKGSRTLLKHCSVYDENKTKDSTTLQAIYGECGENGNYGTYQTFYIDFPTMKFWKKDNIIREEFLHDSIMKQKTSNK